MGIVNPIGVPALPLGIRDWSLITGSGGGGYKTGGGGASEVLPLGKGVRKKF